MWLTTTEKAEEKRKENKMESKFKVGDEVIKSKRYSAEKYCKYGGSEADVPLGASGVIRQYPYDNETTVEVIFDGGHKWSLHTDEIELVKKEEDTPKKTEKKKTKKLSKDNEGLTPTMGDMFARVVMPKEHKKSILEALVQENIDYRNKMYKDWGFDEVVEKGKGLIFLFYGEPGTGKTMCAQAIAEHLGRKWMLIGTAELQSSVPGQMERNIKEAFKKAKESKLVIIFDECDSLLYNRNHVGAILGAEINCLLSEIERFEGVCILTTNRSSLTDPALERRIALKLEFTRPDAQAREYIWGKLVPKKCPIAKDVCFKTLAKEFDITGGNIKNIVLSAARRAIYNKKSKISMDDFLVSIEREFAGMKAFKTGATIKREQGNTVDRIMTGAGIPKGVEVNRVLQAVKEGGK